jgi:hypothetical protein
MFKANERQERKHTIMVSEAYLVTAINGTTRFAQLSEQGTLTGGES